MASDLEQLADIAEKGGSGRVDGHTVDSGTAEAIVKVYQHLNGQNQKLFADLPLKKKAELAFKLIKREINEQEDSNLAQVLSQVAQDPAKKAQMIRALNQASNKPKNAQQNQQGQNTGTGTAQKAATTGNTGQAQQDTQSDSTIKPTGGAQTNQMDYEQGTEVDPNIQQTLKQMNLSDSVDYGIQSPLENLNSLRAICAKQVQQDDQLRTNAGRRLGNMVDINLGDYGRRDALELFCSDPARVIRGLIMQYGDPAGWTVKSHPDGSALVIASNGDAVIEWISSEHGEQFVKTARDINKHNTLSENKRSKIMRMPKELKESIKTFNVSEKEFSDAIQRRLRNARQNMSESDYNEYKSKLVEHATSDPRKFVAFIGASDKKLAESYRGFSRLRKTITEGKTPSVRGPRKKVSESAKSGKTRTASSKTRTTSRRK
jgi:hypothetical protein